MIGPAGVRERAGIYIANATQRSLDRITSSLSDPGVRNVTQHGYTNHLQLLDSEREWGREREREREGKKVVGLVS